MRRRMEDVWVVTAQQRGFASLDEAKARLVVPLHVGATHCFADGS